MAAADALSCYPSCGGIRLEQGKCPNDRNAMLSPQLLDLLRGWWRECKQRAVMLPRGWLFPVAVRSNPCRPAKSAAAVVDDLADQEVDAPLLPFPRDTASTAQHRKAMQGGPGDFSSHFGLRRKWFLRAVKLTKAAFKGDGVSSLANFTSTAARTWHHTVQAAWRRWSGRRRRPHAVPA